MPPAYERLGERHPSLSSTGDFDAALAGFLALGISLLGLPVFGCSGLDEIELLERIDCDV